MSKVKESACQRAEKILSNVRADILTSELSDDEMWATMHVIISCKEGCGKLGVSGVSGRSTTCEQVRDLLMPIGSELMLPRRALKDISFFDRLCLEHLFGTHATRACGSPSCTLVKREIEKFRARSRVLLGRIESKGEGPADIAIHFLS